MSTRIDGQALHTTTPTSSSFIPTSQDWQSSVPAVCEGTGVVVPSTNALAIRRSFGLAPAHSFSRSVGSHNAAAQVVALPAPRSIDVPTPAALWRAFASALAALSERAERIPWHYKILLTAALVLAITVPFYLLRESIAALGNWGYPGAFLINGLSSASVVLPAPGGVLIAVMAERLDPILIGIASGIGGGLGGITAYAVGSFATGDFRDHRWLSWLHDRMAKSGTLLILAFATIPVLPGDVGSMMAGATNYPLGKCLLLNCIGGIARMTLTAYVGAGAIASLERLITGWITLL